MRFEENSNCTLEERIKLVAKEIVDAYPEVSLEYAKTIAMHDEPISEPVTNDMKFIRYYYMMMFLKDLRYNMYIELYRLYNEGLNNKKLSMLMEEIDNYMLEKRKDFPIISELYNY